MESRAQRARARQRVDLQGGLEALHGHRAQGLRGHKSFRKSERVGRQQHGAWGRELFHPGGQVRRLADRGVVDAQIAADGADHDLARVQPDPDLHRDAVGPPDLVGVSTDRALHVEGRIAGADRVVLVGKRRAEEGHDPVAHHLVHRALVSMNGLHHPLEHGVQELARLLGVAVGE